MKSFVRTAAAAWAVAGALLLVSYEPAAQMAIEENESPTSTREYDVRDFEQRELWITPRTGAIGDVLAPDRLFFTGNEHEWYEWSLRDSGEEARCWEGGYDLGQEIEYMLSEADIEVDNHGGYGTLQMHADAAGHEAIDWIMGALNEVADARVSMVVYRLPEQRHTEAGVVPANELAGWTKGARFVGNYRGGLAEPFVLQNTQHQSYVADYDLQISTGAAVAEPRVNNLNTGEEFVLGAISLSDGRLWVQGWHASMSLKQMRTADTNSGMIELPDVSYSFTPVSAVIENAGGAIIDAGDAGRFLVRAECDRVIRNLEHKLNNGRTMRLLNCAGTMRGHGLGGFWLMNPNSNTLMEDSVFAQVILPAVQDGPYMDAALMLAENANASYVSVRCMGPYLGVVIPDASDMGAEEAAAMKGELRQFESIPATLATAGVRIRAFDVADNADLPAGILTGRPSAADVAELATLAGKAQFDRVSTAALETQIDQFEVRLLNHLREYNATSATEITALDPAVGTLVTGEQIRWQARQADGEKLHIEVRSGITTGGTEFENFPVGSEGLFVERSRSALTQGRMADELAVGEYMAAINPGAGAGGRLVIIVVERLQ